MGKLTAGQWTEIAIWVAVAAVAYGFSFGFDRNIEMYKFGASGWPRAVVLMIALAAVGQFLQDLRKAKTTSLYDPGYFSQFSEHGPRFVIRMGLTLLLPLLYALMLQGMGYYFLTVFFLMGYLYLTGEHRPIVLVLVPFSIFIVVTFVFTRILYVGLPTGYWPGFYDFGNWFVGIMRG